MLLLGYLKYVFLCNPDPNKNGARNQQFNEGIKERV